MLTPHAARTGAAVLAALTDSGWCARRLAITPEGRLRLEVTGIDTASPDTLRALAMTAHRHLVDPKDEQLYALGDVPSIPVDAVRGPGRWFGSRSGPLQVATFDDAVEVVPHDPVPADLVERCAAAVDAVTR